MAIKVVPAKLNESGVYEPVVSVPEGVELTFDAANRFYLYDDSKESESPEPERSTDLQSSPLQRSPQTKATVQVQPSAPPVAVEDEKKQVK